MNLNTIDIALNTPELWNAVFLGIGGVLIALKTGRLSKEMRPNGGNSLRDAIDRIESKQAEHDELHTQIIERIDQIATKR